jgi:hypothetical protein
MYPEASEVGPACDQKLTALWISSQRDRRDCRLGLPSKVTSKVEPAVKKNDMSPRPPVSTCPKFRLYAESGVTQGHRLERRWLACNLSEYILAVSTLDAILSTSQHQILELPSRCEWHPFAASRGVHHSFEPGVNANLGSLWSGGSDLKTE